MKIHASKIDPLDGLELAVDEQAISADHLAASNDKGKEKLRNSNTTVVLLPAITFYLGREDYADARGIFGNDGVIALATDYNPGSGVTNNLQLVMAITVLKLKLSPGGVRNAVTTSAAKAIGINAGAINTGSEASLVIWDAPNHEYILYHFSTNYTEKVIGDGKVAIDNTVSFRA